MEDTNFILQSLGMSHFVLQEEMISKVLIDAASKILKQPGYANDQKLIAMAAKLIPHLCEPHFSEVWLALLQRLSNMPENDELNYVYDEINKRQAELFPESSLPVELLSCLWLTHLTSLESCVLMVVRKISEKFCFPNVMQRLLEKSCLVQVASKEPLIYQTVFHMLHSLLIQSNYPQNLLEFMALFCHTSRSSGNNEDTESQLTILRPQNFVSVKSLFTCFNKNSSPKTIGKVVAKIHEAFILCRNEHAKSNESLESQNMVCEELWSLTMEFRDCVLAAINCLFHCDLQDLQPCLWILLMHRRITETMSQYTITEKKLTEYIHLLRTIHNAPQSLHDMKTFSRFWNNLLLFDIAERSSFQQLIVQILVGFFFQSSSGFRLGQEFIAQQPNAQVECITIQVIQYCQQTSVDVSLWSRDRKSLFKTFLMDSISWSYTNPGYTYIQEQLVSLLSSVDTT
ncbi:Fanconi anemia group C protein [Biomphalaria glabrata]|uniref:Uncharacterized protein LOC106062431 isoform X1 n=1 Tax=Biomphalaria glabrata TaxID=6526 RepID=A0A9W3AGQ2_BIOGL|nr:uncharacterized protein LOC106062431 isoform X1 [Biomphalaria glabrata]XP_055886411.1 uncharacterized protein LOC106062431 isoform X1 [Biomphalaria glabrata]XP_055886412.1 uncharacterized protein LOC106062431 isoform X1 [Biomphalaria glabrata]KAI8754607.1 putative Fanconi anemia group C protein [Biomphalaria glabrata]KAI8773235.1 Fanconi anemia group C protein [Biomphalaria glabrata]